MESWMLAGVTLIAPEQTSIDPRTKIGEDTIIHPFTTIEGPVSIGKNCVIGPHVLIRGPVTLTDGTRTTPFQAISE